MGVSTCCGHRAQILIFRLIRRAATDRVKWITPPLAVAYTGAMGMGKTPPADATVMITPVKHMLRHLQSRMDEKAGMHICVMFAALEPANPYCHETECCTLQGSPAVFLAVMLCTARRVPIITAVRSTSRVFCQSLSCALKMSPEATERLLALINIHSS